METPEIISWTIRIGGSLIVLWTILISMIKQNRWFCFLPNNHYAGVFLSGKFSHIIIHKDDYANVLERIDNRINSLTRDNPLKSTLLQLRARFIKYVRPRSGFLVETFNLCLIDPNPLMTLKKVTGAKKYLVEKAGKNVGDHYREEKLEDYFLRIVFPRVEMLEKIKLNNNTQVDFVVMCADMMIADPKRVFVDYNGDIEIAVDGPLNAAYINYFGSFKRKNAPDNIGPMTYNEFQKESFSANIGNPFNEELLSGNSFYESGLIPDGPFSISYFELSGNMTEYARAQQEIVVAEAKREAEMIKADGTAQAKLKIGKAEAEVDDLKARAKMAGNQTLADIAISISDVDQMNAYVQTVVATSIGSATAPLSIGGNGFGMIINNEKEKSKTEKPQNE